ncbi:MAG: hypothetical protein IKC11_01655, partial [Clostridia bacterium]|nr:hypothetical protein [Clostridia bacterium]
MEYIGQGESVKQSAGFLKDIIDVNLISRASKYGQKIKEKTLYPISRLVYPNEYSEFLEDGPGLSFFPANMRDKTKFGRYLDAIKQTRINQIPDSELYIDKKGDLYEWGGGLDINKIIYDKDDLGFLEGPDRPLNVQRVYEMKLQSAKPKVQKLKRALARDIDRRYEGKREGVEDISWPRPEGADEDVGLMSGGEFIDKVESDPKFKREVMSKKLFESMQAATDYDNWKNNLGSKAFTEYDLQDLENEIKLIESLSYKDIRKVCSDTIDKFIKGKEVTYDDIYNDLVSLMGTAPLPKNVLPEKPKFRSVAEQFQKRVDLLPGVAPTVATLGLERAVNLGKTAALAKFTEYVPEIGGALSTGIGWVGGTVGAVGAGLGAAAGIGLFAVMEIAKIIVRKILSTSVDKLASQKTSIAEAANDVKEECIENLKEQKQEVLEERQEKLEEAKQIRIAANKGEITSAERDELLKPLAKEALVKEKEAVILDAFEGAMKEDQKEKMKYELIESDTKIKIWYTKGKGRDKKPTSATLSRYVNRDEIEEWKQGNEKRTGWLSQQADAIDRLNKKNGYKKAGPNPARVAYFELKYGVKLPTIDVPKTENLLIDPNDIDQILERNRQTNKELRELNSIQTFDFGFGSPLDSLKDKEDPVFPEFDEIDEVAPFQAQASQLKRKQVSLGKSDTTHLIKRPHDYSELEVPEGFFSNTIPSVEAKIEEELPLQLKRKQVSLGKSDTTHLIKRPHDYSELEVPEGFFSNTIPSVEA